MATNCERPIASAPERSRNLLLVGPHRHTASAVRWLSVQREGISDMTEVVSSLPTVLLAIALAVNCTPESHPRDTGPAGDSGPTLDGGSTPDGGPPPPPPDAGPGPTEQLLFDDFVEVSDDSPCVTVEGVPEVVETRLGTSVRLTAEPGTDTETRLRCAVTTTPERLKSVRFRVASLWGGYDGAVYDTDHHFVMSLHAVDLTVFSLRFDLSTRHGRLEVYDHLSGELLPGEPILFDAYYDVVIEDFDWEGGNARLLITTLAGNPIIDTRMFVQAFTTTEAVELAAENLPDNYGMGRTLADVDFVVVNGEVPR